MNDFASRIEALEHRWMRAWIARDRKDMKALAARDLVVLFGGSHPVILDRVSWLDATEARLRCSGYRFGTIYVRRHGKSAIFAAPVHLDATVDGNPVLEGRVPRIDLAADDGAATVANDGTRVGRAER